MSGPKVVRIVTREELLESCQAALARVDAALADWERIGERNGVIDEESRAKARERREKLDELLAAERFDEVQKLAPMTEAFLCQDVEKRLEEQASRRARELRAQRSVASTAAALLKACAERGMTLPEEVSRGLERGEQAAVASAFRALGTASDGLTSRQRELAARLGEDEARRTLDDWLVSADVADVGLEAAERDVLCLEQLGADAAPWEERLSAIRRERDEDQRGLRLDATRIELRKAVQAAREASALRREAAALGDPREVLLLVEEGRHDEARAALGRAEEARRQAAAARALVEKRRLVLEGLQALGYDVREGMATAWARQGRIVVRNPRTPDTGVEVAGNSDRLQVRVVGYEGGRRDVTADGTAEVSWCEDVHHLQAFLADRGGEFVIERAIPAGEKALKVVPGEVYEEEESVAARHLRAQ